jgi:hypothetical protein
VTKKVVGVFVRFRAPSLIVSFVEEQNLTENFNDPGPYTRFFLVDSKLKWKLQTMLNFEP